MAKKAPKSRTKKAASAKKRSTSKRDLIDTRTDQRYVKRTAKGRFKDSDDRGLSLSADRRKAAKTKTKSGYGDQGDRKRTSKGRGTKKK